MLSLPRLIERFVVQNDSYESGHGEFAHRQRRGDRAPA